MTLVWFAILLGVAALTVRCGLATMLAACMVLSIFQAAAAIGIGGFFLQPGFVFLLLIIAAISLRAFDQQELQWLFHASRLNTLVLLFTAWCIFSAIVLPRVFGGTLVVFPLQSSLFPGQELARYYLRPEPTNFNQSSYAVLCMLACLTATFTLARDARFAPLRKGIAIGVALLVVLGLVQWVVRFAGMEFKPTLLYNNTSVALQLDQSFGAVPRINVTFIEPSSLAVGLAPFIAYLISVAIIDHRARRLGWLALGGALILVLSTSTTAYLGLGVALASVPLAMAIHDRGRFLTGTLLLMTLGVAVCTLILLALWVMVPALHEPVLSIFNATVTDKGMSSSAIERRSWNQQAWDNFLATWGLGTGFGSSRASGLVWMLLGNTGIPGFALFCIFVVQSLLPGQHDRGEWSPDLAGLKAGVITATVTLFASGAELTALAFWLMLGALAVNRIPAARALSVSREIPLSAEQRPAAG